MYVPYHTWVGSVERVIISNYQVVRVVYVSRYECSAMYTFIIQSNYMYIYFFKALIVWLEVSNESNSSRSDKLIFDRPTRDKSPSWPFIKKPASAQWKRSLSTFHPHWFTPLLLITTNKDPFLTEKMHRLVCLQRMVNKIQKILFEVWLKMRVAF